ncbi:MAG: hypothetical protein AVDCRST_MAG39-2280 [uncultured Sphingomonadaceae bacterium]|uniref:Type II secretion system protein J n=1 Tax=uncultured Sphingomonadaceae bacterium TaxID=169976 RepID=A0A6J4TAF1_9SPHN|nr:MAG: hypothetical protein AVDCRST_MAG39-2280 [uncultured Sphingomonadaceae bacterium]
MRACRQAQAGFTLVEVIVSLALFALISLGGLALVDTVLRAEERLGGRLDRLGELQRAMLLVSRDLEGSEPGTLAMAGDALRFARRGSSLLRPALPVAYALRDGALVRGPGAGGAVQRVLPGVAAVRWRFLYPGVGWSAALPDPEDPRAPTPRAAALEIDLAAGTRPGGALRRVVELPLPSPRPAPAAPDATPQPGGLLDRAT